MIGNGNPNITEAGPANSGATAIANRTDSLRAYSGGQVSEFAVAGAPVTPGASISVTVGAGGSAGTAGAAGGSGYVYIEYYEEV